ncbi:MAG: response regulator transcription factor [Sulfurimonas sp.]|uniref:response regulator transcription factor n=1 Tax=Sulfurimonas sp. TaxID=2022749 RepID=UPI0025EB8BAB|nr:response regulator transcription factor [Sulfurimonas sp.]MCK9491694.1 response regulator transcription factor [Sulfurimonas sp.]
MKDKSLKSLRVLFVEDEENIARLLKEAIGDSFYSFTIAKDGRDGLEMFEKISPDIVITDINMPNMNGLEMANEIKKINQNIPIIILSAFSDKEKFLGAIDTGVAKYFLKPYEPDEILSYISSIADELGSKTVELCEGFSYNKTTHALYKDFRYVSLSKNENKFLKLLVENENSIIDDETIKISVWDESVSDERLRTFVRRLRAKTSKTLIINIKGVGYKLRFFS